MVVAGGAGFTLAPGESKFLELMKTKLPWAPKIDSEIASASKTVVHRVTASPKSLSAARDWNQLLPR